MSAARSLLRLALLGLLALGAPRPARAQLDPRLQASATDFLDLYQQSTSLKAKPEVLSIMDCSSSMSQIMFHPLYRNNDLQGQDDFSNRNMNFALTGGRLSYAYLIRAKANNKCGSEVYYGINEDAAGAVSVFSYGSYANTTQCLPSQLPTPWYLQTWATAVGSTCNARIDFAPDPAWTGPTAGQPYPSWKVSSYTHPNLATATCANSTLTRSDGSIPTQGSASTPGTGSPITLDPPPPSGGYYTPGTVVTATVYNTVVPTEGGATYTGFWWQGIWTENYSTVSPGGTPLFYSPYGSAWGNALSMTSTVVEANRLYKSVLVFKIPNWVPSKTIDPVVFTPLVVTKINGAAALGTNTAAAAAEVAAKAKGGDTLTFSTSMTNPGTATKITWWVYSYTGTGCTGWNVITPVDQPTNLTQPSTANWTIPIPCAPPAITVSATIDCTPGLFRVPGVTYLPSAGAGFSGVLVKPDGSLVTVADAEAAKSSTATYASYGKNHIANWIRAASHVRFSAFVPGAVPGYPSGVTRTVDVPIPWKVFDRTSSGNPLSEVKLLDRQVKSGVTYGSGLSISLDTLNSTPTDYLYNFYENPSIYSTLPSPTGARFGTITYPPGYFSWLFTAKYQNSDPTAMNYTTDSTLVGKFVVFDAANDSIAGRQKGHLDWGQGFGPAGTSWGSTQWPSYNADGTYAGLVWADASSYRTPSLTRLQALKQASIKSWIDHQADAYWAFRRLDPTGEAGSSGSNTTFSNSSYVSPGTSPSTWVVLNNTTAQGINSTTGNSVSGMAKIAALTASGSTPLTYGLARSLAQYGDPSSVFNAVEGVDVSQCGASFILLITDGLDNNGLEGSINPTASPYFPRTTQGPDAPDDLNAATGNRAILADPTTMDRFGKYWNLYTMAGAGAHMADPGLGTINTDYLAATTPASKTGVPHTFLPLAIKARNGITLNRDRRVLTMTLGVSMGGFYTDPAGPKRTLFLTAVAGDPWITSGPLTGFTPFNPATDWVPDPRQPTAYPTVGKRRDGSVFFFDATDPDKLASSMDFIFRMAAGFTSTAATASPTVPFVGASLGSELYLGSFSTPSNGGSIWTGDLLSFGLKISGSSVTILNNAGTTASVLDATTAIWSAAAALRAGPVGTARKLYTRIPYGSSLATFSDTGSAFDNSTTGLVNFVATGISDKATKKSLIRFVAGADTTNLDSSGNPKTNRTSIMGDIINSAPAVLEYAWSDVSSRLGAYSRLAAVAAAGGNRFRIHLVGTNQGWLHAFGEVTRTLSDGRVAGDVQELWSFLPTDFLANLNYLSNTSNPHRFMVDGNPTIYHLDLPPASGGSGNGVVDTGERVVAVFGLRKGGRSYYALDIHDPFTPALKWSLVPDEAATLGAERVASGGPPLAKLRDLVGKFGFSTSTPAFGRVQDVGGAYRDAVFLGGGYSNPETDAQFSSTKLGRSAVALDVYTGEVLAAVDLLTDSAAGGSSPGPLASGVVPFEFIVNSGMAQRAYFLDYAGGLWAWGSKAVSATAPYVNFRVDSSKISDWSLRKVYQDDNANLGALYTTPPAPFRVGSFLGKALIDSPVPATVGVAMVSGDRNNPLDQAYSSLDPGPSRHRLTVVFDRQDSRSWGFDSATGADAGMSPSNLKDFTTNVVSTTPSNLCTDAVLAVVTPGCDTYYLAPKTQTPSFGYLVNFPVKDATTGFVPKGISPPLVSGGSLFYSYFTPVTFNACTGGTGTTSSWLIADVLNPLVTDNRTGRYQTSGQKGSWYGVASDFMAVGSRSVLQAGMKVVAAANAATGTPVVTALTVSVTTTAGTQRFAKPRVWRTVH